MANKSILEISILEDCLVLPQFPENDLFLILSHHCNVFFSCYADWHEHSEDLIQLFFWGTHTTELLAFLNPINDMKAFNETTFKVSAICRELQHLSLVNFSQAVEQLFFIIFQLETSQAYREVKPRYSFL